MSANIRVYIEGYSTIFPSSEEEFPSRFQSLITNYVNIYVDTARPELVAYIPGTSSLVGSRVENLFYHYEPEDSTALFEEFATVIESLFDYGLTTTSEMETYRDGLQQPAALRQIDIPNWLSAADLPAWMWLPEWLWLDPDEDEVKSSDLPRGIRRDDLRRPAEQIESRALPDGVSPSDVDAIQRALPSDRHPDEFPRLLEKLPKGIDLSIFETEWSRHESDEFSTLAWELSSAEADLPGLTRLYRDVLDDLFGDGSLVLGATDTGAAASVASYIHENNIKTTIAIEDDTPHTGAAETTLVLGNQNFAPLNSTTTDKLNEHTKQVRETLLGKFQGEATNEIDAIVESDVSYAKKYSELKKLQNLFDGKEIENFELQPAGEIYDIYNSIPQDFSKGDLDEFVKQVQPYLKSKRKQINGELVKKEVSELGDALKSLNTGSPKQTYTNYIEAENIINKKQLTEINENSYDNKLREVAKRWKSILIKRELDEQIRSDIRSEVINNLNSWKKESRSNLIEGKVSQFKNQLNLLDDARGDSEEKIRTFHILLGAIDDIRKLEEVSIRPSRVESRIRTVYDTVHNTDYDQTFRERLTKRIRSEIEDKLYYTYYALAEEGINSFISRESVPQDELIQLEDWITNENDSTDTPNFSQPELNKVVSNVKGARDDQYIDTETVEKLENTLVEEHIESFLRKQRNHYEDRIKDVLDEFINNHSHQFRKKKEGLDNIENIINDLSHINKNSLDRASERKFYNVWSDIQNDQGLTQDQVGELENIARNIVTEERDDAKKKLGKNSNNTEESLSESFTSKSRKYIVPLIIIAALVGGLLIGGSIIAVTGLFMDTGGQDNPQGQFSGDSEQFNANITEPTSIVSVAQENMTVRGNTTAPEITITVYNQNGSELKQSETISVENETFSWTTSIAETGLHIVEIKLSDDSAQVTLDRRIIEAVSQN